MEFKDRAGGSKAFHCSSLALWQSPSIAVLDLSYAGPEPERGRFLQGCWGLFSLTKADCSDKSPGVRHTTAKWGRALLSSWCNMSWANDNQAYGLDGNHATSTAPGKAAEDGPNALGPGTHMADPDRVPGSWLWPSTNLVLWLFGGVYQQLEGSLSLSLLIFPSLPPSFFSFCLSNK